MIYRFYVRGELALEVQADNRLQALGVAAIKLVPTISNFYAWDQGLNPGEFHAMFGLWD